MEKTTIETKPRFDKGKNGSHRLRAHGWVPAVMYGKGVDPFHLAVERNFMNRLFHTTGGVNRIYSLKLDDKRQQDVLIRDYQLDPVRDELIHVDFLVVSESVKVQVKVPIETDGVPVGVKTFGGLLVVLLRELPVECFPQDIPEEIRLNVTNLNLNQSLKVKDITLSDKVKVLVDPEINVVHVEATRALASEETAAEAEAKPAEGEAEAE